MDGYSSGSVPPPPPINIIDVPDYREEKTTSFPIVYALIEDRNDLCVVRSDEEKPEVSLSLDQAYSLSVFIRSDVLQKNDSAIFIIVKECGETKNSFQIVEDTPVVDVLPFSERLIVGNYTLIGRTQIIPKRFGFDDDDKPHLLRCCLPYQGECAPINVSLKAPSIRKNLKKDNPEPAFA